MSKEKQVPWEDCKAVEVGRWGDKTGCTIDKKKDSINILIEKASLWDFHFNIHCFLSHSFLGFVFLSHFFFYLPLCFFLFLPLYLGFFFKCLLTNFLFLSISPQPLNLSKIFFTLSLFIRVLIATTVSYPLLLLSPTQKPLNVITNIRYWESVS